jgi:steroid delta-isomerase-like uncharacterized protein
MDNADVVRQMMQAINDHDRDAVVSLVASSFQQVDVATGQTYDGPAGMGEYYDFWLGAFPDGRVELTNLVASGDTVVTEYTGRGTNTGPLRTPEGEIPPTGRSVELAMCDVSRVEGGKIVAARSYYDSSSLIRQLGLLPEAAGASTS